MKILMVINNYLPFIGGAEIQAHKLSKQLLHNGHSVHVLTSKWNSDDLASMENIDNIRIFRVPCPAIRIGAKTIGQSFLTFCSFLYYLAKCLTQYDIIHVHQALRPALAVAIAGKLLNRPTICKIGNSGELFDLRRYENTYFEGRYGASGITNYIDVFVSISTKITNSLSALVSKNRIMSIPNGVDIGSQKFPTKQFNRDMIKIISVGSLTRKKCFDLLIDAIAMLEEEILELIELKILGDGPERQALQAQITKLKLHKKISLLGNVNNVGKHLQNSDVFMLVSEAEGMSNSLLEALSYGLPAICSDVGNNAELVLNVSDKPRTDGLAYTIGKSGIIFDPGFISAIKQSIESFLSLNRSQKIEMGENAATAGNKYNIELTAKRYELLYSRLIKWHGYESI